MICISLSHTVIDLIIIILISIHNHKETLSFSVLVIKVLKLLKFVKESVLIVPVLFCSSICSINILSLV